MYINEYINVLLDRKLNSVEMEKFGLLYKICSCALSFVIIMYPVHTSWFIIAVQLLLLFETVLHCGSQSETEADSIRQHVHVKLNIMTTCQRLSGSMKWVMTVACVCVCVYVYAQAVVGWGLKGGLQHHHLSKEDRRLNIWPLQEVCRLTVWKPCVYNDNYFYYYYHCTTI